MKGDSTFFNILAYPTAYLSCFLQINLFLFNTFKAYILLVFLYLAKNTCPKPPFPKILSI